MNLILPIFASFLLVLLQIVFYSKKRIDSAETNIYKYLMMISSLNIIFNIIGIYTGYNLGSKDLSFLIFLNHIDLPLYFWWASLLFLYFIYIDFKENKKLKDISNIVIGLNVIFTILTLFLPFNVIVSPTKGYAVGACVNFVYFICGVYIVLSLFESVRIIKKGYSKKAVPLFALIFLGIVATIIQKNIPNLIIIPAVIVYIELIMFFTIENPDLKILEEYNKNRELVEFGFEERANMLFKITEDVRTPIKKIKSYSDIILKSSDKKIINEKITDIYEISNDLVNTVDDVLSISALDKKNLKLYDASYDVYNLFNQIIYIVKSKLDKTVNFKYSIDNTLPSRLYGDSAKLKQVICSLLLNNNKINSVVDLDISYLVKNDICRLIITINDSSIKMSLTDINKILSSKLQITEDNLSDFDSINVSYDIVKKIVDLLDGTFLIKTYENGTIFKVIINQVIEQKSTEGIVSSLAKEISNKKKILLLDDDYKELSIISSELKKYNYEVISVMYGDDILKKLSSGEKFDILLIDDEMIGSSAVTLIKKVDELKLNNLVKIIMLNKDKEFIKQNYIDDYSFADYLLKNDYKKEIKRIKETYK